MKPAFRAILVYAIMLPTWLAAGFLSSTHFHVGHSAHAHPSIDGRSASVHEHCSCGHVATQSRKPHSSESSAPMALNSDSGDFESSTCLICDFIAKLVVHDAIAPDLERTGATDLWQPVAHPDVEQSIALAYLSRGPPVEV